MLALLLALTVWLIASAQEEPPGAVDDICRVFAQYPHWYDQAMAAQQRWGTPVPIQMAIVRRESSYRASVRPPRPWYGIIPLPRESSAYGYPQAQDPVWGEYREATGGWFQSRDDMADALDFIGWFTRRIREQLGLAPGNAYHVYLAYHQGIAGFRRGDWRHDPGVLDAAGDVQRWARQYDAQLDSCQDELRCWRWYEFEPFCGA